MQFKRKDFTLDMLDNTNVSIKLNYLQADHPRIGIGVHVFIHLLVDIHANLEIYYINPLLYEYSGSLMDHMESCLYIQLHVLKFLFFHNSSQNVCIS